MISETTWNLVLRHWARKKRYNEIPLSESYYIANYYLYQSTIPHQKNLKSAGILAYLRITHTLKHLYISNSSQLQLRFASFHKKFKGNFRDSRYTVYP